MLRRFSVNFTIFSMLLDGSMVIVSLYSMTYVRLALNELPFIAYLPPDIHYPNSLYFVFPLLWVGILAGFSIYDGRKFFRLVDELSALTMASLVAAICQAGFLYLTFRDFSRALFILIVIGSFLLCVTWRLLARLVFRIRKETLNLSRKLLVVGVGSELHKVEKSIRKNLSNSLIDVYVLDLKNQIDLEKEISAEFPKVVTLIREKVKEYDVSDVIISFPRNSSAWIEIITSHLDDLPLGVWIALDFYDLSLSETKVENIAGVSLLDLRAPALDDYSRIIKRTFDLVVGSLLLLLISPVMLIVALLVLIIDGWPVFFLQNRVGENGTVFRIIKFRTMIPGAENLQSQTSKVNAIGEIIHKEAGDPRVTGLGKILRRLSLDELPQFFNVLKGEMSLVGPRPELPFLVEKYEHWQRRRLSVAPGITGWWQVTGRSDKVMHLHTEDDLYYVENYSIWLDIQILIRTIWVVIVGKGSF